MTSYPIWCRVTAWKRSVQNHLPSMLPFLDDSSMVAPKCIEMILTPAFPTLLHLLLNNLYRRNQTWLRGLTTLQP